MVAIYLDFKAFGYSSHLLLSRTHFFHLTYQHMSKRLRSPSFLAQFVSPLGIRFMLPTLMVGAAMLAPSLNPASKAETTNYSGAIPITSVYYGITQPGTYYLANDLSLGDQTGIGIQVGNVSLDLNGHTLTGTAGPGNSWSGIYITADNVAVYNGTISGFGGGIGVLGNNCRVENITISEAPAIGIYSSGANNLIRKCHVINIGGSTLPAYVSSSYGIWLSNACTNDFVVDCDVSTVTGPSGGIAVGIENDGTNSMIVNNRMSNCNSGVIMQSTTTKYRDNICTTDVAIPYSGGTNAGNNN